MTIFCFCYTWWNMWVKNSMFFDLIWVVRHDHHRNPYINTEIVKLGNWLGYVGTPLPLLLDYVLKYVDLFSKTCSLIASRWWSGTSCLQERSLNQSFLLHLLWSGVCNHSNCSDTKKFFCDVFSGVDIDTARTMHRFRQTFRAIWSGFYYKI